MAVVIVPVGGGGGGGTSDHGSLSGLADDDHAQYHNDTRGDARYPQKANTWHVFFYTAVSDPRPDAALVEWVTTTGLAEPTNRQPNDKWTRAS